VVADALGNLYLSDGSRIRKQVIATGEVTTVAGSDERASVDGVGSSARFDYPQHLAVDGERLYVSDEGKVRVVELATGEVRTLVGIEHVWALHLDGASHLYVSSWDPGAIRRIDLVTGDVRTVVGNDHTTGVRLGDLPGSLNEPTGVTLTPAGELILLDERAVLRARL